MCFKWKGGGLLKLRHILILNILDFCFGLAITCVGVYFLV